MAEMRFEHSIDLLLERKAALDKAYHALLNQACRNEKGLQSINRQIIDIEDTINNLYAIREVCPDREM